MLRFAKSLLRYPIRQSKPKPLTQDEIQQQRDQIYELAVHNYNLSTRPHEDRVYEERIYGRNCYVVGLTPLSQKSNTYIKSVLTNLKPGHVILGGFNNTRLISSYLARTFEDKRNLRAYDSYIQPSKLFCKSLTTPMVTKLLQTNPNYRVEKDTDAVQWSDHRNKCLHSMNYVTIMNSLHYKQFTKLSFGMPSDIILFQDIMINQSLEDLRAVFVKVINATADNKNEYGQPDLSFQFHPEMIYQQMSFLALNEPIIYRKQLTYTTALLNKSASIEADVTLFVDNRFVQQVAENVHKVSIDPKDVFRQGCTNDLDPFIYNSSSESGTKINAYLNATNKDQAINELLEKFAILKYLKDYGLQMQLLDGQNIFQKTVFRSLFQNLSHEQILRRYNKAKQKYKSMVSSLLSERLMNTKYFKDPQKQFYTLNEMIHTQQQRNIDYPISFVIRNKQEESKIKLAIEQIKQKISEMIKKQLPESDRQLMNKHLQGYPTKESIVLYEKLLVEAKIRLKKFDLKLPIYHRSLDLSSVFKDQLQVHLLNNNSRFLNEKLFEKNLVDLQQKNVLKEIDTEEQLNQLMNSSEMLGSIDEEGKIEPAIPRFETDKQYQQFVKELGDDTAFSEMYKLIKEGRQSYEEQIIENIDEKNSSSSRINQDNQKKSSSIKSKNKSKIGKKRR